MQQAEFSVQGPQPLFASAAPRLPRLASVVAVAALAIAAVGALAFAGDALPNMVTAHVLTFYAVTAGAYVALPFVRRGDVLMAGVWLVLAAGVGPCVLG